MAHKTRCEGYRRRGGAFTFGPVTWKQCEEEAVVNITVEQTEDGRVFKKTYPACMTCWNEAIEDRNINVLKATPIMEEENGT